MNRPRGSNAYEELASLGRKRSYKCKTWMIRAAGIAILLGLFLATSLTLGRKDNLHKVLLWIHQHRLAGFVIFCLLYIWFTVLFLPPALLAACAGAIYGFIAAIPLVWVCAVLGETVSFLLGRFLLKRWVKELTAGWPMWTALDAALSEDGWKLVTLLRVSPVVPFSILNYALGSSSLPFSQFWWPSVFGILPGLIIYVYLGSLAADVSEAISAGPAYAPPAAKIAIIVVGLVSALLVVILSAVYTKRAIDRRLAHVHIREEVSVEERHYLLGSAEEGATAAEGARGVVISVETSHLVVDHDSLGHSATAAAAEVRRGSGPKRVGGSWGLFKQKPSEGSHRSDDDESGLHEEGALGAVEREPLAGSATASSSSGMHGSSSGRQQQQSLGPPGRAHPAVNGVVSGSGSTQAMQRRGSKGELQK